MKILKPYTAILCSLFLLSGTLHAQHREVGRRVVVTNAFV